MGSQVRSKVQLSKAATRILNRFLFALLPCALSASRPRCDLQTLPQPAKVDRPALTLPQDLSASPADFRLTNSNAERVTKLQHMLEIGDIA